MMKHFANDSIIQPFWENLYLEVIIIAAQCIVLCYDSIYCDLNPKIDESIFFFFFGI